MTKQYDRAYFERWYRHPRHRVTTRAGLERKVRMTVGIAEFMLNRRIRSVLDVGCGEAPWYPMLRTFRRDVRYIGVESSEYAVEKFGKSRHIKRGSLGELHRMKLPRVVDLIVCSDVLQYVPTPDVERGLRAIRRMLGGIAYIESFTTEDAMEGDHDGWHERSAAEYRELFRRAGLTQCGPYCYVDLKELDGLTNFEHM
jgi:SAM-dependent methyltransferase